MEGVRIAIVNPNAGGVDGGALHQSTRSKRKRNYETLYERNKKRLCASDNSQEGKGNFIADVVDEAYIPEIRQLNPAEQRLFDMESNMLELELAYEGLIDARTNVEIMIHIISSNENINVAGDDVQTRASFVDCHLSCLNLYHIRRTFIDDDSHGGDVVKILREDLRMPLVRLLVAVAERLQEKEAEILISLRQTRSICKELCLLILGSTQGFMFDYSN